MKSKLSILSACAMGAAVCTGAWAQMVDLSVPATREEVRAETLAASAADDVQREASISPSERQSLGWAKSRAEVKEEVLAAQSRGELSSAHEWSGPQNGLPQP